MNYNSPEDGINMSERNYSLILQPDSGGHKIVAKVWANHVKIEDQAVEQIRQTASMPFVKPYVAVMPDAHYGMGATVGSVVPTVGAVMPAAVGVDIGCGMMAVRTNLTLDGVEGFVTSPVVNHERKVLSMQYLFDQISKAIPHGRSHNGGVGDIGSWGEIPQDVQEIWSSEFEDAIEGSDVFAFYPGAYSANAPRQLGTLGTGNHFIELVVEIDNPDSNVWVVIHSGSRGFGNKIGSFFTRLAGKLNEEYFVKLPNKDLGYLVQGSEPYEHYLQALELAQKYAWRSREIMMDRVLKVLGAEQDAEKCTRGRVCVPPLVHMHHNYLASERHFGVNTLITRKGAVDAALGKFVIIPGSMGAKTYIARGLGNLDSFHSCSHGAGRAMSRGEALRTFSVADHIAATEGVYCDKTEGVLDETPGAYKSIEAVMESQKDLVEPILALKQIVSVKGISD